MQHASDYEFELMKIIWANGGIAIYSEIFAELEAKGNSWTKNTIVTLLSRLVEKGMLTTSKTGRRNGNLYTAVVTENDYQADQTVRFLDKIFEGDTKGLISTLVEKDLLSSADYEELRKYWQGGEKSE
jgi:predicted transcriptional regulator